MKLATLLESAISQIKTVRWDRIIEKHEGPEDWESVLRYSTPEFIEIDGEGHVGRCHHEISPCTFRICR